MRPLPGPGAHRLGSVGRRFGLAGLTLTALLTLVALLAPLLAPHDPDLLAGAPLLPPGGDFPLGTNDVGQDILSQLIFGARTSLAIGLIVAVASTGVGTLVGLSAGLARGLWDDVAMRTVDVILTIPFLPLLIVLQVFLGGGPASLVMILASVLWARPARELRSQVLSVRERGHVQAAIAMGSSAGHLLGRHVLPAVTPILVPQVVRIARSAILLEASLSFLGLGDPTLTSWGTMLFHAQARSAYLTDAWLWWIVPPGLAIGAAVLGVALIGYAAEELTRPRLAQSWIPTPQGVVGTPEPEETPSSYDAPLRMEGIEIRYGSGPGGAAVADVDLELRPGEVVGLVGESGSGKTTLATAALGLVRAPGQVVSGDIRVKGRSLTAMDQDHLRRVRGAVVALVPQNAMNALNPVRPVLAQVVEARRAHSSVPRRSAESEAARILVSMGIEAPRHGAYPHELSGGMRQRVLWAMALVNDPDVLVADEPTTGLDAETTADTLKVLEDLRDRRGLGVLLVSHDLSVVLGIADRVLVMHEGRIVEEGPAALFHRRATHPQSLRLLGAHPETSPGGAHRPTDPAEVSRAGSGVRAATGAHARPEIKGTEVLSVEEVSKEFTTREGHRIVALDRASLTVATGEIVGLLGRSGAGKTTLARIIVGLETADAGRIVFEGRDLTRLPPRDRRRLASRLHLVFQDPYDALPEHMSVRQIVTEPLRIHHPSERSEWSDRVRQALDAVELEADFLHRFPHELSGGERQRVALARAVVLSPRCIVTDEPASLLDAPLRREILSLLAGLRARFGTGILYITHDRTSASSVCDRVLVLSGGRLTTREL